MLFRLSLRLRLRLLFRLRLLLRLRLRLLLPVEVEVSSPTLEEVEVERVVLLDIVERSREASVLVLVLWNDFLAGLTGGDDIDDADADVLFDTLSGLTTPGLLQKFSKLLAKRFGVLS